MPPMPKMENQGTPTAQNFHDQAITEPASVTTNLWSSHARVALTINCLVASRIKWVDHQASWNPGSPTSTSPNLPPSAPLFWNLLAQLSQIRPIHLLLLMKSVKHYTRVYRHILREDHLLLRDVQDRLLPLGVSVLPLVSPDLKTL